MLFRSLIHCSEMFLRCRRGNFALIFALAAPVLLGLTGGAVDLMVYNQQKSAMQNAADAAVLAATREASLKSWLPTEADSVAKAYIESELADAGMSSTAKFTVVTAVDNAARTVNISLDMDQHRYFLLGYFRKSPQIRVTAAARLTSETPTCVIGLDPSKTRTVQVINEGEVHAEGCAVYSNSTDKAGLFVDAYASMSSAVSCSAGGFGSGASVFLPTPTTDCPPMPDPLAARQQPTVGSCDFTNYSVKNKAVTLNPGVYCKGIAIDSNAIVTMKPGVYIINGGSLLARGNGSLTGDAVTIFFTGADGKMDFDGTSKVSLKAPSTGLTAGLLFMQDRKMSSQIYEISSQAAPMLLGTIYLPNGTLKVRAPGKVADKSAFTVVVARSIEIGSEAQVYFNSNYDATTVPVPAGLGGSKSINLVN